MKYFLFFGLMCILFSCTMDNNNLIIGKWKAIALRNPVMEKSIANAHIEIDTFGKNDAIAKEAVNLDSFKKMRLQQLEIDVADQKKAFEQLTYEFSKTGVAYLNDGQSTDSAKWNIEEKNILRIDPPALSGIGDLQLFTIKKLAKDTLTLLMIVGTDTSEMDLQKVK